MYADNKRHVYTRYTDILKKCMGGDEKADYPKLLSK